MNIKKIFSSVTGYLTGAGDSFLSWAFGSSSRRNRRELLNEFKGVVYTCISIISEEVAKYTPNIYTKDLQTGELKIKSRHPFVTLLENPSPTMSPFQMFEAIQAFMELTGDAFLYVSLGEQTRKPKSFDVMRPDRIKIVINEKDGEVIGYTFMTDFGTELPLEVDEVIHFKTFNPLNEYRGYGPVESGLLEIDTQTYTSTFQKNFMSNQATPSGVLTLKVKMKPENFEKLKKQWAEQHSGLDNAGKTLIIRDADADFKKIGLSLNELDMGTLKKSSKEDVYEHFRVPMALAGKSDSSGLGRANMEETEYIFAKRTIDPKMVRIDDTLTQAARRYYEDSSLYIKHESQIPKDREFITKVISENTDKSITRNEARQKLNDVLGTTYEDVEGGDKLYYSFNQVPIGEKVTTDTSSKSFGKIVIKSHVHSDACNHTPKKKVVIKANDGLSQLFASQDKLEDRTATKYHTKFKSALRDQKERFLDKLRESLGVKERQKAFDELMIEVEAQQLTLIELLVSIFIDGYTKAGELGVLFIGAPDIEFVLEQATRDSIFNSTERMLKSFDQKTVDKLQKQLAQGLSNGEDLSQLTKRVESIYKEAIEGRSELIARTEAHRAINEATAESFRQSGIKGMRWKANPGACEFCRAMDGVEVKIGTPFLSLGTTLTGTDGGEYQIDYENVDYANLHPRCLCRLEPIK